MTNYAPTYPTNKNGLFEARTYDDISNHAGAVCGTVQHAEEWLAYHVMGAAEANALGDSYGVDYHLNALGKVADTLARVTRFTLND